MDIVKTITLSHFVRFPSSFAFKEIVLSIFSMGEQFHPIPTEMGRDQQIDLYTHLVQRLTIFNIVGMHFNEDRELESYPLTPEIIITRTQYFKYWAKLRAHFQGVLIDHARNLEEAQQNAIKEAENIVDPTSRINVVRRLEGFFDKGDNGDDDFSVPA